MQSAWDYKGLYEDDPSSLEEKCGELAALRAQLAEVEQELDKALDRENHRWRPDNQKLYEAKQQLNVLLEIQEDVIAQLRAEKLVLEQERDEGSFGQS